MRSLRPSPEWLCSRCFKMQILCIFTVDPPSQTLSRVTLQEVLENIPDKQLVTSGSRDPPVTVTMSAHILFWILCIRIRPLCSRMQRLVHHITNPAFKEPIYSISSEKGFSFKKLITCGVHR